MTYPLSAIDGLTAHFVALLGVLIGGGLVLLAARGGRGGLAQYLVLWVLPMLTVLQVILRLRAICEHGAVTDLSSPLTAVLNTTTQVLSTLNLAPVTDPVIAGVTDVAGSLLGGATTSKPKLSWTA